MKIVFAPDSFKGSLSAGRICELLEEKARLIFPGCETVSLPVSDGGEGAAEVVVAASKGEFREVAVRGPMGKTVRARYGICRGDSAIIEMAAASGLPLVPPSQRNVRRASTYGTGELIADALDRGIRQVTVAIGGSATNDGGIGCAAALGVRFLNRAGETLEAVPERLGEIDSIDLEGIHPAVKEAEFSVMCDVTNPLLGERGATRVFGPQKGASPEDIFFLERGMEHYAEVLQKTFGRDFASVPGAGAAGGLGVGLMAFADAGLRRGVEAILDLLRFDRAIDGADLIVTGEGRIDGQSVYGKVPWGVGMAAKRRGIPCVAIAGQMGEGAERIYDCGVEAILTTIHSVMPLDEAMERSEELFLNGAERLFRMVRAGRGL